MKVAITGGTGFVGSKLVKALQAQGHELVVLTRDTARARRVFPESAFPKVTLVAYTPQSSGPWQAAISGCDGVVNLAGAPISERWTPAHKKAIMDSRKVGTEKIVEAIAQAESKPSVLVSASAIGYYGTSPTRTFDESGRPDDSDFLSRVCQAWEAEASKVKEIEGVRLVIPRIGIVLGEGGALGRMLTPFRLFAGGPIGSGQQWFSWIHIDDLVALLVKALTDSHMSGVYNATAPNPVRMGEACEALGQALNRPSWLPVPDFVIEALLGDGAVVVLEGQQVVPRHLTEAGFTYQYPTVDQAMKAVVEAL
ncbi:TIGR01777 family oxidoreductase [Oscillatoria sp. CS-180]|uniref:thylakoid membrane protein ThyD n=1 Tax=Oscillatoria sp. CS-180 TaxID=3021720 RepID=UPI0023307FB2|nr:TIGR01777 family oxidoreductase [Oscillatoria sp. CS-180]MDB9528161.1 TIGR01777 family oxidoreductase [Oscillatoria sp. CS-180]